LYWEQLSTKTGFLFFHLSWQQLITKWFGFSTVPTTLQPNEK
jgi:hypothetical protein